MIVMHSCQCEKPKLSYARFGRFGRRTFREDESALAPPSEETVDAMESFEVPSPGVMDAGAFKTVVKTAVVFWAVTRILDHVFLGGKARHD